MNTIEIEKLNGVEALRINLDGPGVYVARGPNGSGKTSTIEAMRAVMGDKSARVEASDGQAKGEASMSVGGAAATALPGVRLVVGHKRKLDGYPPVRLLNTGALGQLIDPQIKDSETAAKARVRALVTLMPLPADQAAKDELSQNDPELQEWLRRDPSGDAMELAESVRRRANEMANECEKESAAAAGEEASMLGLIQELGALDFEAGDYQKARAEADRMMRQAEVMTHQANARARLEAQQSEIRGTLGPRPDLKVIEERIAELSTAIGELDRQMAVLKEKLHHARMERARTGDAVMEWDKRAELLNRTPEGPSVAEAQQYAQLAEEAAGKALRAQRLDTAQGYMQKAEAAKARAAQRGERGRLLRGIAQGTALALGRLLERSGLPGMAIAQGRLVVRSQESGATGEIIFKDFETRLSFGEKVRKAIEVALIGTSPEAGFLPVLPLEPGFWLALDGKRKVEVRDIAIEKGVCLITEEPGEGPLRVESMSIATEAKGRK